MRSPCQGCADRSTGCHATCARYAEYRAERDRQLTEKQHRVEFMNAKREAYDRTMKPLIMKRKRRGK